MSDIDMESKAPNWFNQTPGTVYRDTKPYGYLAEHQYAGVVCGLCEDSRYEKSGAPVELVSAIITRGWRNADCGWVCPFCVAEMKKSEEDKKEEVFGCEACEKEKGWTDAWSCYHQAGQRWRAHQEENAAASWDWADVTGKSIHIRVVDTDQGRGIVVASSTGVTMTGRVAHLMSAWIIKQMEGESNTRPDRENDLLVAVVRSAVSDRWHVYAKEGKVHARYTGDGVHNVYPEFIMGNEPIGDFVTLLNQYRP